MSDPRYATLGRADLERKLAETRPDNAHSTAGYALVNVLPREHFERAHIPDSINIPVGEEEEFERRFDRDKEIVVYCASPDCDASPKVAAELARRGFAYVQDYEEGLSEWQKAGHAVASGAD